MALKGRKADGNEILTRALWYLAAKYPDAVSPTKRTNRDEREAMRIMEALRVIVEY